MMIFHFMHLLSLSGNMFAKKSVILEMIIFCCARFNEDDLYELTILFIIGVSCELLRKQTNE